jgi:hypothetical protein
MTIEGNTMSAQSTGNKTSSALQIVGYVVGTVWFAFLALSESERPTLLRFGYGVTAAVFLGGAVVTAVVRLRRRSGHAAGAAGGSVT